MLAGVVDHYVEPAQQFSRLGYRYLYGFRVRHVRGNCHGAAADFASRLMPALASGKDAEPLTGSHYTLGNGAANAAGCTRDQPPPRGDLISPHEPSRSERLGNRNAPRAARARCGVAPDALNVIADRPALFIGKIGAEKTERRLAHFVVE